MATDWTQWENRIDGLLPNGGRSPDRPLLLDELSMYARAVVRQARRELVEEPSPERREHTLKWLDRPIFLLGHHRSGTTLLASLLDAHPELVVLPSEGTYFTSFRYVARPSPAAPDVDRFLADWISRFIEPQYEPHFRLGRTGPEGNPNVRFARRLLGWQRELQRLRPAQASFALLLALVAAFRDVALPGSESFRFWVEKTPRNENFVERLARGFPDARFIQLVREPRATLASMLRATDQAGLGDAHAAEHARTIAQSLRRARRNERRFAERYLVVRYEDLVEYPRHEMGRVRAFLGISEHPSLLTPSVLGSPVRPNSSFEAGEPGVVHRLRPRPLLSPVEDAILSAFASSAACVFGYRLAAPSIFGKANHTMRGELRRLSRGLRTRVERVFTVSRAMR